MAAAWRNLSGCRRLEKELDGQVGRSDVEIFRAANAIGATCG